MKALLKIIADVYGVDGLTCGRDAVVWGSERLAEVSGVEEAGRQLKRLNGKRERMGLGRGQFAYGHPLFKFAPKVIL